MDAAGIWFIVYVTAVFVIAGMVKGATGMGLPTVAMAALGSVMPPVHAAALMTVPSLVTNIWQLFSGPSFAALILRLWPMMAGVVAFTIPASLFLTSGSSGWTTTALGAALAIYAGVTLFMWQLSIPKSWERVAGPLVGAITGTVTGATGVFVMPAVPYLQALGLRRDELVQALGLSFTISTLALSIGLVWGNAFDAGNLSLSAAAIVPALAGMWLGQKIRMWVKPETFRRWFLVALLLLGLELATRPLRDSLAM